jgi:hypothetical protein
MTEHYMNDWSWYIWLIMIYMTDDDAYDW